MWIYQGESYPLSSRFFTSPTSLIRGDLRLPGPQTNLIIVMMGLVLKVLFYRSTPEGFSCTTAWPWLWGMGNLVTACVSARSLIFWIFGVAVFNPADSAIVIGVCLLTLDF